VRQHSAVREGWPFWANAFADEIERLWAENAEYEEIADLMFDALLLIQDGPADPAMIADAGWYHGVAAAALASLKEKATVHRRRTSSIPRFLPRSLGGEASHVDGPGVRL